jgi:ABC-2 type transport system permease protein
MINAIRSEWMKLRSARSNIILIILAIALPLILSVLIASLGNFRDSSQQDLFSNIVLGPNFLCVFLAGVIGVLGIGQEYRHNTIRVTFTSEPRRSRVLAAKVVVTTMFGLGIGLFSQLLDFGVASVILNARNFSMSMTEPGSSLTAFIGQTLLCGLFTLAGFGLGAILRQPAGAIPIILVWPLIIEQILRGLLSLISDGAAKWLPFAEGLSMANPQSDGFNQFSRLGAGLYFAAFVAALVAFGWFLVERRDA